MFLKRMSMKEQFKIGQLSQQLGVKRFVIRFWEKEFSIHSQRTSGGQRYYLQQDFDQFKLIKQLLYEKGFTIAGAKKILHQTIKKTAYIKQNNNEVIQLSSTQLPSTQLASIDKISHQMLALQKKLIKLRELL